jgi:hypothetical protein
MMQLQFVSFDGKSQSIIEIDKYPDTCPICHHKNIPTEHYHTNKGIEEAQICFQCTNERCQSVFIGYYRKTGQGSRLTLVNLRPIEFLEELFPKTINECSPMFVKIYNQALHAESMEFNEISGVGFRKAIEYLIKDYLIYAIPERKEEILKMFLGKCIKELIDDTRIKTCAERAVWLGNDETHYIRQWSDKDINDLKTLIRITINWIESSLLTEEYLQSMPSSS